jgi:hypothetical protein
MLVSKKQTILKFEVKIGNISKLSRKKPTQKFQGWLLRK